jgi:hypothetical protein
MYWVNISVFSSSDVRIDGGDDREGSIHVQRFLHPTCVSRAAKAARVRFTCEDKSFFQDDQDFTAKCGRIAMIVSASGRYFHAAPEGVVGRTATGRKQTAQDPPVPGCCPRAGGVARLGEKRKDAVDEKVSQSAGLCRMHQIQISLKFAA